MMTNSLIDSLGGGVSELLACKGYRIHNGDAQTGAVVQDGTGRDWWFSRQTTGATCCATDRLAHATAVEAENAALADFFEHTVSARSSVLLPPRQETPTLRQIARLLSAHLEAVPENDVHWISVVGEDNLRPPIARWTDRLRNSLLQVSVANGFSEGMLVYVHAQRDRYRPASLRALFCIKLLCGARQAFDAARQVREFFEARAF